MLQSGIMKIDDDKARLAITMMLSASPDPAADFEEADPNSAAFLELDFGMAYEKGAFSPPVLLYYTVSPNWTVKFVHALRAGAENASFLIQWAPSESARETVEGLENRRVAADISIIVINDADTSTVKRSTAFNVSNLTFNPAESLSPFAEVALSFNDLAPTDRKLTFVTGFDASAPHTVQVGFGILRQ